MSNAVTARDPLAAPSVAVDLIEPSITKTSPKPWRHQVECYTLASQSDGFFIAHQMGCGKSRTTVDILQNDDAGPILVCCPKAVVATWPHEVAKHAVDPWPVVALRDGTIEQRLARADEAWRMHGQGRRRLMVVVNYDTIYREAMLTWISDRRWAAIVCDESHRIKSYSGKQSKALHRLSVKTGRRLCLTGTPIPHSPLDLFGQFRFLDAKVFGTSYTRFRSRYAVTNPMFPSQVRRWTNLEELNERFYSRAHRVLASEVLDLPPKIDTIVPVQLGPKARRIYESLKSDLIAEIETAGGPAMIQASNALVKLLRLQQITGGCITAPDLSGVEQVDWAKQDALTDLLEDMGADERVVVFCRFRADIDSVREVATKLGRPFGELSGRANDLDGNQMPDTPGLIMAVQIASGGAGVDLTRSSACVYWSLGFSLGEFEQSVARLHRPGQTRPVRYWHLIAEDTVDEAVYHALQNRREVVEQVLGGL